MAKINRGSLTKFEIIRVAARKFLEDGYTATSVKAICNELNISTGNLTFYYPTKDHMLATLVHLLCDFQRKLMGEESQEGNGSLMAICLELATMVSVCEQNEIAKDFFLSAYRSPMALEIIQGNDTRRSKEIFRPFCEGWNDEDFAKAEVLVSGIEYATMTTSSLVSMEHRIVAAVEGILRIYRVPEELIQKKIQKLLSMDFQNLGKRVLDSFKAFVEETHANESQVLSQIS